MKYKFTRRDTFDTPKVELDFNFAPSWWEGLGVIIFYFGNKIVFWGVVIYLYVILFS
jgi:hypothetical protein|tara:strand:- start:2858 stop:3028 length:171 start_codon:yes stop_codon:yes gene_type:complete